MRNILLGTVAGLLIGIIGTCAYNDFFGDGKKLAQAQAELAKVKPPLDERHHFAHQSEPGSAPFQPSGTNSPASSATNSPSGIPGGPNAMMGFMKARFERMNQQKMLLLKARLKLTPEQEAVVKAAMDAEAQKMEEMATQAMQGGRIDPQAMRNAMTGNSQSLDQALDNVLTQDQKNDYQQMKDDQKKSTAETAATFEMNQAAPMLQMSDSQKEQVYNTLYQLQMNPPSAATGGDPFQAQQQAKEEALSKILSPEQMALYRQQAQGQMEMRRDMMQRFAPPGQGAPPPPPPPGQ